MTHLQRHADTIDTVKKHFKEGLLSYSEAADRSRKLGYNMAKLGRSKKTGMGGNWAWFKR